MSKSFIKKRTMSATRIRKADLRFQYLFEAFGVTIRIVSNELEGIRQVESALSVELPTGISTVCEQNRPQFEFTLLRNSSGRDTVRGNRQTITSRMDRERTLEILVSQIRLKVAELARQMVFVHAGVVGWRGKAILIPGSSFSGKSTLTAELVKQGAEYYSDEYAVLDSEGLVHPFPKPLSIRGVIDEYRQTNFSADEFGGIIGVNGLPVGLVLLTQYSPGATFKPEPLTMGSGIIETIRHTISIRQNPAFTMATLGKIAESAIFIKTDRGEANVAAKQLLDYFDSLLSLK